MLLFDELSDRPAAAGETARRAAAREGLVPNPKARLKAQFHEVCRFKHLAARSEEAYWGWVVRLVRKGVSPEYLHKSGCSVEFGHAPRVAH